MAHGSETAPAPRGSHPTAPNRGRLRGGVLASLLVIGLGLGSGSCRTAGAQESTPTAPAVEVDLPAAEPGTPTGIRAETSHLAWLALLLPVLILTQWSLVLLRDHVRDRIHRTARTSDPTLPERASPITEETIDRKDLPEASQSDLESVIGEELVEVFADGTLRFAESANDAGLRDLLTALATSVAVRAETRVELTEVEKKALRTELVAAVLEAFDLAPVTA